MTTDNERLAIVETEHKNLKDDMQMLFKFHREHMKKEDARWEDIHEHMIKQKTFVGTVIFITSALWAGGIAILSVFKPH